jgi:hypothetical protein
MPILVLILSCCGRSYWVEQSDLKQAQQVAMSTPKESIALRASPGGEASQVYLRYSMLSVVDTKPNSAGYLKVKTPDKRGKRIEGIALLGIGGVLLAGGMGLVFYWVSSRTPQNSDGDVTAALFGTPPLLGGGLSLLISGAILTGVSRGPLDFVRPEAPAMTYVPIHEIHAK